MLRYAALCLLLLIRPLWADPAPPQDSPGITILDFGVYCRPQVTAQEEAPETALGYINIFSATPTIRFHGQQVHAALGVSFGLLFRSDRDILQARMESWKPGRTEPEIWYTDIPGSMDRSRGFTFDFEEELIPGLWRLEAWDGDQLLYRIEFDVLPPSKLPAEMSDCNLMS